MKKLNLGEHELVRRDLQRTEEYIGSALVIIEKYGGFSRPAKLAKKALATVGRLLEELDKRARKEYPL